MGPRGLVAWRLWTLLGHRGLASRAGFVASEGSRLRLPAAGRLPAGPALRWACLPLKHARGLHGGPGLEEREDCAAGEGRPQSSAAGMCVEEGGGGLPTAAGNLVPAEEPQSSPLYKFVLESKNSYRSRARRDFTGFWRQLCRFIRNCKARRGTDVSFKTPSVRTATLFSSLIDSS